MVEQDELVKAPKKRGPATVADVAAEIKAKEIAADEEPAAVEASVIFKAFEVPAKPPRNFDQGLALVINEPVIEKFQVKAAGRGVSPETMFRQSLHLGFEIGAFETREEGIKDTAGQDAEANDILLKLLGIEYFNRLKALATEKNASVLALFQAGFYTAFVEKDL